MDDDFEELFSFHLGQFVRSHVKWLIISTAEERNIYNLQKPD
ncbi:hypothetical protein DOY81_001824 [Sarcophaga bullata]|nr:hypothetical protein DOY81_001824 [Sarcophaga bullata]